MRDRDKNLLTISISLFLIASVVAPIFLPQAESKTIILQTPSGTDSCVTDFVLAQNLTDLCDVTIINPLTSQIIEYNGTQWINVNSTTFSDTTVCNNLGTGAIICAGGNVNLRSIIGSSDISVVQNANDITIDYNGTLVSDNTVCANVGGGFEVFRDGECNFRTLLEGTSIDITQGADTLTLTNTAPESTTCNNVGTGNQLCSGGNVNIDTLIAGTGISITDTTDDWTIANTAPDDTACFNVGTGLGVYSGGECQFDSLIAGTGITITDTTDDLTFASQCANTGTGEAVCESANNINSLIAGTGITITDTTGDLTISATGSSGTIGQLVASTFSPDVTKTNVGVTYVDVYTAGGTDDETLAVIHCGNATQIYGNVVLDYGATDTGTQSIRLVNVADNTQVFLERTDFVADANGAPFNFNSPNHGNWRDLSCSGTIVIELQIKSTVAGDDPTVRAYNVYTR